MKLHELADRPGARKKRNRIGRGIGSGSGKTGGRGGKGRPRAPACASKASRAARCRCTARLPKRGFKNTPFARKLNEINLGRVQAGDRRRQARRRRHRSTPRPWSRPACCGAPRTGCGSSAPARSRPRSPSRSGGRRNPRLPRWRRPAARSRSWRRSRSEPNRRPT